MWVRGADTTARPWLVAGTMAVCIATICLLQAQRSDVSEHIMIEERINSDGRIISVQPSKGPYQGHSTVTITGESLFSGGINDIAEISLNRVPVQKIISMHPGRVVVRTGSLEGRDELPGQGDVLIDSHSQGRTVGPELYEYKRAPMLFSVEPDSGAHIGGTRITIRGDNLCDRQDKKPQVELCDQYAKVMRCDKRSIVAVTAPFDPERSIGEVCDLRYTSKSYGVALSEQAFTYRPAPVITRVTPSEGRYSGGNKIRIYGSELTSGKGRLSERVTAMIGGSPAHVLDYTPSTVLLEVPEGLKTSGPITIEIQSRQHGKAVAHNQYRLHRKPVLRRVFPATGRADGGEHLTLIGDGLGRGDIQSVRIGGHHATVLFADRRGRKVKVLTPKFDEADEGRKLRVTVRSRLRGQATLRGFKVHRQGIISSVKPAAGPAKGGALVTITGRNLGTSLEDFQQVMLSGQEAAIVSASPSRLVVKTLGGPAGASGAVEVHSSKYGKTKSHGRLRYSFNKIPQVVAVEPSSAHPKGGELLVVRGEHLCNAACDDLQHIQVGDHIVTKFMTKSPNRISFYSPAADAVGGPGLKTILVQSAEFGQADYPEGLLYRAGGAAGRVQPSNIPLKGGSIVTIEGPELGHGDSYRVLLAGVEARVLSASPQRLEVQAGDAKAYAKRHGISVKDGLLGDVIIEAIRDGESRGLDTLLQLRYNPECEIKHVKTVAGPLDGQKTIVLQGHHLGMGDESILFDGEAVDGGLTLRKRYSANVHSLSIPVSTAMASPDHIELVSARTGHCFWRRPLKQ